MTIVLVYGEVLRLGKVQRSNPFEWQDLAALLHQRLGRH
jgi:hypothetical protein